MKRVLLSSLAFVALCVFASVGFFMAVGMPAEGSGSYVLPGGNMEPTLHANERVIADAGGRPTPGAIVIFSDPNDPNTSRVSRVIAIGGQSVDIRDGKLYVDGKARDFIGNDVRTDAGTVAMPAEIPDGQLWVMGDNRPNSGDSRFFGPIPESSVKGIVTHVYWPVSAFRAVGQE